MSLDLTDNKSTLVQVMAWCPQATSLYLSQCWPRSLSPYGVTRPQWVKFSPKSSQKAPHSLPVRARYWVSCVGSNSSFISCIAVCMLYKEVLWAYVGWNKIFFKKYRFFHHIEMIQIVEIHTSWLVKDSVLLILFSQYQSCWCPGNTGARASAAIILAQFRWFLDSRSIMVEVEQYEHVWIKSLVKIIQMSKSCSNFNVVMLVMLDDRKTIPQILKIFFYVNAECDTLVY